MHINTFTFIEKTLLTVRCVYMFYCILFEMRNLVAVCIHQITIDRSTSFVSCIKSLLFSFCLFHSHTVSHSLSFISKLTTVSIEQLVIVIILYEHITHFNYWFCFQNVIENMTMSWLLFVNDCYCF